MAGNREISDILIRLNVDDANAGIKKLTGEIDKLEKSLKDVKGNPAERRKIIDDIEKMEADSTRLRQSIKTDLRIIINGDVAGKSLKDLNAAASQLKREMRLIGDETDPGFIKKAQQFQVIKQRIHELEQPLKFVKAEFTAIGEVGSLNFLKAKIDALTVSVSKLKPHTKEFNEEAKKLQATQAQFDALNNKIKGTDNLWSKLNSSVKQFGILAAGYLGFQFITSQISNVISKQAKLSDQLADIRKTTGLAAEQVERMNSAFSKIDTRTGTTELRNIAIAAGQLGIAQDKISAGKFNEAREELVAFTKAIDTAVVALGDEFTGGAQQVASEMGKLRLIFKDIKSDKIDQDILHIGNAINVLATAGAATGPVVADFSNRIGAIGIPLGLSTKQVLGLSATLQELNVSTERGGTAIGKILQKMTSNVTEFAKIAGQPVEEFKNLLNTDLFGAFSAVVEGSQKAGSSATALAEIMKDAELQGSGASEVFLKLSNNMGLLREKVNLAGDALKNTDSITNEFNIKNATLGAIVDKLGKEFFRLISSKGITEFFKGVTVGALQLIQGLQRIPEFISKNITAIITLAGVTLSYYGSVVATTIATIANTTATLANAAANRAVAIATAIARGATLLTAAAYNAVTGNAIRAAAAMRLFSAAASFNPFGAALLAITALAAGISFYVNNTKEALKLERDKRDLDNSLAKAIDDVHKSQENLNREVDNFNKLSPKERAEITEKIKLKKEEAIATLQAIEAKQEEVSKDSGRITFLDALWSNIKTGNNQVAAAQDLATKSMERQKETADKYSDKIKTLREEITGYASAEEKATVLLNAEKTAMALATITTDQYEEKLRLLKVALSGAAIGSEDYLRITKEIQETQKAFSAATGPAIDEDALEKLKDLRKQLQDVEQDILTDKLGKNQQEIAAISKKYDELREKAKGHAAELKKINELQRQEIEAKEAEHAEKISELRDQLYFSRLEKDQQEIVAIQEKYAKLIEDFAGYSDKIKELEVLRDEEIAAKREEQAEKRIEVERNIVEQVTEVYRTEAENQVAQEENKWRDLANKAQTGSLLWFQIIAARHKALADLEKKQAKDRVKLEEETWKKIYKQKLEEIELSRETTQAFADVFHGLFNLLLTDQKNYDTVQKTFALVEIAISSAVAISKAVAAASHVPFPGNIAAIASSVAVVLANIAKARDLLKSADNTGGPTTLAEGGFIADGPAHKDGGLQVVDTEKKKVVNEIEGGEAVISKETTRKKQEIIDDLIFNKGENITLKNKKEQSDKDISDKNLQKNIDVIFDLIATDGRNIEFAGGGIIGEKKIQKTESAEQLIKNIEINIASAEETFVDKIISQISESRIRSLEKFDNAILQDRQIEVSNLPGVKSIQEIQVLDTDKILQAIRFERILPQLIIETQKAQAPAQQTADTQKQQQDFEKMQEAINRFEIAVSKFTETAQQPIHVKAAVTTKDINDALDLEDAILKDATLGS